MKEMGWIVCIGVHDGCECVDWDSVWKGEGAGKKQVLTSRDRTSRKGLVGWREKVEGRKRWCGHSDLRLEQIILADRCTFDNGRAGQGCGKCPISRRLGN